MRWRVEVFPDAFAVEAKIWLGRISGDDDFFGGGAHQLDAATEVDRTNHNARGIAAVTSDDNLVVAASAAVAAVSQGRACWGKENERNQECAGN